MPKQPTKKAKAKKEVKADKPKKTRIMTPAILENPGGRPSDFERASPKIIECLRKGNTYECAAGRAGVTYKTFSNWKKQGEEDGENGLTDSKFFLFFLAVQDAETEAEEEAVKYWRDCLPGNWQAAKEFLARRNPDKWGSKDRVDVTSKGERIGKPFFMPLKDEEE